MCSSKYVTNVPCRICYVCVCVGMYVRLMQQVDDEHYKRSEADSREAVLKHNYMTLQAKYCKLEGIFAW